MKIRASQRLLAALMVGLFSLPAVAQYTRDASANSKIDEAINNHYLMMQLDKAEGLLTGTIAACENKCSPQTKAKAWMYVGVVRGSGKNDQAGAAEAFAQAKGLDPAVKLDEDIASPETKATFDATPGAAVAAAPVAAAPVAAAPVAAAPVAAAPAAAPPGAFPPPTGVPGDMLCSPQGEPVGVNMPIPLSCTSDADVASGFVKFQEPGSTEWKKVKLTVIDGMWQGDIPCTYTKKAGDLKFYVGVKDANGEYVDQFGSKKMPGTITLAAGGAAPAFPGQPPVVACVDSGGDCPPDFPGCESAETKTCGELDWGAACSNSSECACGLLCEEGQCATAPSCSADSDCDTGSCVDGTCSVVGGGADASDAPAGPFKRHWLSFAAGLDLMPMGGNNLCSQFEGYDESYGIQCYDSTTGQRIETEGVDVNTGIVPAQLRVKLGYDYALTDHVRLGARAGFAFLNTRPSGFLPIHVEGRFTYTFTSLANAGVRPSLYAGFGMAESNGKIVSGNLDIYKLAGQLFVPVGGSLGYAIAPNMTIAADVQLMVLLPAPVAMVIHPGASFTYAL